MCAFFPTTFMLRVSFSPAPECVEVDCWNQAFQTPPCHQDAVVIIILIIVVVIVIPALTKDYIGNTFLKAQNVIYDPPALQNDPPGAPEWPRVVE